MDISLLSKMISQLILDRDEVALPGMGTFVAETMPASFSDKGYTINPPYRRLSFYGWKSEDNSLAELYARSNAVSISRAELYISAFVQELKETLEQKKTVVFPGLGRLRATRDNKYLFVSNEDLDIFTDGVGLVPVSLKNNNLDTDAGWDVPEFISQVPQETADKMEVALDSENQATSVGTGLPETATRARKKKSGSELRKALVTVLILLGISALALVGFLLASKFAPDFVDSILYTEEELEILRW